MLVRRLTIPAVLAAVLLAGTMQVLAASLPASTPQAAPTSTPAAPRPRLVDSLRQLLAASDLTVIKRVQEVPVEVRPDLPNANEAEHRGMTFSNAFALAVRSGNRCAVVYDTFACFGAAGHVALYDIGDGKAQLLGVTHLQFGCRDLKHLRQEVGKKDSGKRGDDLSFHRLLTSGTRIGPAESYRQANR